MNKHYLKVILITFLALNVNNIFARQEKPTCEELAMSCDEVLQVCEQVVVACDNALQNRGEELKAAENIIDGQAIIIQELTEEANHSHIPHVAGTSAFWILLLILL